MKDILFLLIALCILVYHVDATSSTPVLDDIIVLDCNGVVTLAPWIPFGGLIDYSREKLLYEWFVERLWTRFTCACPSTTKKEFLNSYAFMTADFWFNVAQGPNRVLSTSCPDPPFAFHNITNFAPFTFGPFAGSLANYQNGQPVLLKAASSTPGFDASFQLAIQKCPGSNSNLQNMPYISLSCAGTGCRSLGQPCNGASDCTNTEVCTDISTGNHSLSSSDFLNAMISMLLYNSTGVPNSCPTGDAFFVKFVNFVRAKVWNVDSSTYPYNWGTPTAIRLCLPQDGLNSSTYTYGCNVMDNVLTCPEISTWDGTLNSGSSVVSTNRMNGQINPSLTFSAVPTLPADQGKPTATLSYHTCTNDVGILYNLPGVVTGLIGAAAVLLDGYTPPNNTNNGPNPPPGSGGSNSGGSNSGGSNSGGSSSGGSSSCSCNKRFISESGNNGQNSCSCTSTSPIVAITSALASIRFKAPLGNLGSNLFFSNVYSVEQCRATSLGGTLSVDAFKMRFGWIPDYLMRTFFQSFSYTGDMGPAMTDWSIMSSTKVLLPSSCSYNTWQTSGTCSFKYTGLQSLLNLDITIRFYAKSCSGFSLPSITVDCSGSACSMLNAPQVCSTDADCSSISGTICWDPSEQLSKPNIDVIVALLNLDAKDPLGLTGSCFGASHFVSDVTSFLRTIGNVSPASTDPLKFCFPNVTKLKDVNFTSWIEEQVTVNGDVINLNYLSAWTPTAPPLPPAVLTFSITLTVTTTADDVKTRIINILISTGFNPNTFTITVVIHQKRAPTADITVTSNDPQVSSSIATQVSDPASAVTTEISSQIGTVSSVVPPTNTGTTTGGPNSPSNDASHRLTWACLWLVCATLVILI